MQRLFKYLYGPSSRLLGLLLALMLTVSCSQLNPLSLLTGSGPNVAANTQVGKENNQNVGFTTYVKPEVKAEGSIDTVDQSTTNNTEVDPLLLLLLILGWLAPSPQEIGRGLSRWLKDLISRK